MSIRGSWNTTHIVVSLGLVAHATACGPGTSPATSPTDGGVHDSHHDAGNELDSGRDRGIEPDSSSEGGTKSDSGHDGGIKHDGGDATPDGSGDASDTGRPAEFSCVGTVVWPTPVSPTYTLFIKPIDYETGLPIVGATIKVCATTDMACDSPSATYTTDSSGSATVTAPSSAGGIDGYAEVSAPGYATTLTFIFLVDGAEIISRPGHSYYPLILATKTFTNLVAPLGGADPTRGALAFQAVDCTGAVAAGVSGSVSTADSETVTGYIAGFLTMSSTATMTGSRGQGGIANIPPGPATFTSTIVSSGRTLGTEPIVIRAGAVTEVSGVPTP